jgi:hypothetical protein
MAERHTPAKVVSIEDKRAAGHTPAKVVSIEHQMAERHTPERDDQYRTRDGSRTYLR